MEHQLPPPPPAPPAPPTAPRRLVRFPGDGPLGGVCAGVARYFDVDPVVVRIATAVLAFVGPGVPAYLIAWAFVPKVDGPAVVATGPTAAGQDRGAQVVGIGLLLVAVTVLWGDWWSPARGWLVPLACIGLGTWLLTRSDDAGPGPTPGDPPPPPPVPATPGPEGALATDPTTDLDADLDADPGGDPTEVAAVGDPSTTTALPPVAPPPAATVRRRRMLTPATFGALLLWAGLAVLFGVEVQAALAVALCIVGVGFVLGAVLGGSWALLVPAVLLGGALVVTSIVDVPLRGGLGDRTWRVTSPADLDGRYELAVGEALLDLSGLELPAGREVEVDVQHGIGKLVVLVPAGAAVDVQAEVGLGKATVLGRSDEGVGVDVERELAGTGRAGTLDLELEMGVGEVEVRRVAEPDGTSLR